MTTIDPTAAGAGATATSLTGRRRSLPAAVAEWITTTDHKQIGRLYVGASLLVLLGVTVVAVLLGAERIDATGTFLDTAALPQLFAACRVLLTFGVVVPLGLGLATAIVPLQLGARSIAFPRLAVSGFWAWLVGAALVVVSIAANGGPGGGDPTMVDLFLLAHVLVAVGLAATAGSVVTTVLTTRAPGMNMRRVPLFAWSALVQGLGLLLVLPVLTGSLVLLYVDHRYSRAAFGGNTEVFSWIGYAFTQPTTALYALPVFGILLDTLNTAIRSKLPMRGIGLIGVGLVGTAFVAGVAQVDVTLPRDLVDLTFGDALADIVPFAVLHGLPLLGALVVLGVAARSLLTRPRVLSPWIFAFAGAGMVLTGLAGNVLVHIGDTQLVGTVFEEGAWIYVCYGLVLGAMGGIVHWGPKLTGRLLPEVQAFGLAALGLVATVLASLPYYVAGFARQPAGVVEFDYGGPQNLWNVLVTIGHGLMALVVVAFLLLALRSARNGAVAGDDPWDGQTLEWATSSPPPPANFSEVHTVSSSEPLGDLKPARSARAERGATATEAVA